jgi:hypothetical protein
MSLGKNQGRSLFAATLLVLAACSGGNSGPGPNAIASAVQDLTLDPEGMTTVITFDRVDGLAGASAANFQAGGGQAALSASVDGTAVTVTWNARVTPSDSVAATGLQDVATSFHGVSTTNGAAPTFVITSGTQNPGLGGDVLLVQFSGAHLIQSQAESLSHWTLTENTVARDLTGSTFNLDPNAQTLTITLGATANLYATYTLAANGVHSVADVAVSSTAVNGTATGDSAAPNLVSAIQNLTLDEYGRVIEFTFDKSMDPTVSLALAHYNVTLPDLATTVTQPAENLLRVTFNDPIEPGVKTVTLMGLVDLHGNAFPDGAQTITQPSPVVNAFNGSPVAVTVPNALNDYIQVATTQAFDPVSAIDPAKWTLHVAGNLINMANQAFVYDFLGKTLTITLDFDMHNGDNFTILANSVLEVDGQTFGQGFFGTVGGDITPPSVSMVAQNRTADPTGKTLDATLSETVQPGPATTPANWSLSGAQNLQTVTLLSGGQIVRLTYDALVLPGSVTLTCANQQDLAGNVMAAPQTNIQIISTDTTPPAANSAVATAVEGADNDTFVVGFNDDMIQSEVETPANWHLESPVGTVLSTVGTNVSYNVATKTGTLTLANGVNLKRGNDFKVVLSNMRDLGANTITPTPITGLVQFETTLPTVNTVYRDAVNDDTLVVRFSEPCDLLTNLYDIFLNPDGTRFILRDNTGALRGYAVSATVQDNGLGVSVAFGLMVNVDDTIDILGVTDLAGNPLFPALSVATVAQDLTQPSLDIAATTFTSVSGENNDFITVKYDRPMSPWQLLDPANYAANGTNAVDLLSADYSFDGTDTVTIRLKSGGAFDLLTGQTYNLGVNNVRSAQGTLRTTVDPDIGITAIGDSTPPNVLVGNVRLDPLTMNSLVIEFTEAMSPLSIATASNYDYNGGNLATGALSLGSRDVRTTFSVTPVVGQNITLSASDLAGNDSGMITRAVAAADMQPPNVSGVAGVIMPGWGGDTVTISFDEPVSQATALVLSHYTVKSGSNTLSLTGATASYTSTTNTVTLHLVGGQELDAMLALSVTVSGVADVSGNVMPVPIQTTGPVSGDTTPPSLKGAFVDWQQDPTGKTIDVLFSEDVNQTFAAVTTHWVCSGGQAVYGVTMMERNHFRLTLSAILAAAQTISITGLPDLANNAAGLISIDPVE